MTRAVAATLLGLAALSLASCAGVKGSPRRYCYDNGLKPGTKEFGACWQGMAWRGLSPQEALSAAQTGDRRSFVEKGLSAFNGGDYETALTLWLPKAREGDPAAQNNMGVLFENGFTTTTPKSDIQAADWYALSAKQGFVQAMSNLARVQLRLGYKTQAISWLQLGARWGDATSIGMLGEQGLPIPGADLAMGQQQVQTQLGATVGQLIGCAIGGGCRPAAPAYFPLPLVQQQLPAASAAQLGTTRSTASGQSGSLHMCADGNYVSGTCQMAPNGTFVGGRPTMAPDGTFVPGTPRMAPDGSYVGGSGRTIMCPDGSYVSGTRCVLAPNGKYVGQ